jgi:DNA-binding transcriptional LysR family regulator
MELRDLRYLAVLGSELHFGRAAARLHMTQPALSQALARLEREIGCPLLQRDTRGATLTEAGRVLLAETEGVLRTVDVACDLARRAGRGETGEVTIGFVDAAVFDIVPPLLRAFRQRYPAVNVTSRQLKAAELVECVKAGQLDLAITRRDGSGDEVEYRTLRRERLALAVSAANPLASAPDIAVADLADEQFIIPVIEGVPSLHALWLDLCHDAGFEPHIAAHISSIQVLIELIANDIGVAFAAESWTQNNPDVVVKPLRGTNEYIEVGVAYRPRQMTGPARNLLEMALRMADRAEPGGLPGAA